MNSVRPLTRLDRWQIAARTLAMPGVWSVRALGLPAHERRVVGEIYRETGHASELCELVREARPQQRATFGALLETTRERLARQSRDALPLRELIAELPAPAHDAIENAVRTGWRFQSRSMFALRFCRHFPFFNLATPDIADLDYAHRTVAVAFSAALRPEWLVALAAAHISWHRTFAQLRSEFVRFHGLQSSATQCVQYLRDTWLAIDGDALLTTLYAHARARDATFVLEPWESRSGLRSEAARADAWGAATRNDSTAEREFLEPFSRWITHGTLVAHLHTLCSQSEQRMHVA